MCELMGISFNKPVSSMMSFTGFINRGNHNPHGWGIAYYPDNGYAAQIIKEPIMATHSNLAKFFNQQVEILSKIFISHVRYASRGSKIYENTHPFSREYNGKDIVFAHNGTLRGEYPSALKVEKYMTIGTTDSEHAFCYLINQFSKDQNIRDQFSTIECTLRYINQFGNFNCLFSDGDYLFCYRDQNGYNGLCFTQRKAPFAKVCLKDEDYSIDLALVKNPDQMGYIVATRPLTDERWQDFIPGNLCVFQNGCQVYPNRTGLSITEINILRYLRESSHRQPVYMIANNAPFDVSNYTFLQNLIDLGYIMQDRRDNYERFAQEATYYTNPDKRTEIDRLLLEIKK